MMKVEEEVRPRAIACDSCRSAASAVYCEADSAFLCIACDARTYAANTVASRRHRLWLCQLCERAPATVTCKADAAALCAACNLHIHSANPLARRHQVLPIAPITCGSPFGPPPPADQLEMLKPPAAEKEKAQEDGAATWGVLENGVKKSSNESGGYGREVDEYLDLVSFNGNYNYDSGEENQYCNDQQLLLEDVRNIEGSDRQVPVQYMGGNEQQQQNIQLEFEASTAAFSYTASLTHSVSPSSMEVSLVPDTAMNDVSSLHAWPSKETIDQFSGDPINTAPQFTPTNREARVLRYKEKRKTRKFEKTIRYASRKAYAEIRPRIKGRFAKRRDAEMEVDQMFSAAMIAENGGYGIVPS
ncbi:Zinc finger protein CONSTANS-like [Asimina triloba]